MEERQRQRESERLELKLFTFLRTYLNEFSKEKKNENFLKGHGALICQYFNLNTPFYVLLLATQCCAAFF